MSAPYIHISRFVTHGAIYSDQQDYQIFLSFLEDYLSDIKNLKNAAKKTFTIRGRTFSGTPHLPQNFFNQIELLAYRLEANRFDLLIKQNTPGAYKKFVRALSTRYALYFNKKYNRKGALFNHSYEIQQIKDASSLSSLAHDLHMSTYKDGKKLNPYSSYPEYLGQRETPWVKPLAAPALEPAPLPAQAGLPKSKPRVAELFFATIVLILFSSYSVVKIESSRLIPQATTTLAEAPPPEVLGEEDRMPEEIQEVKEVVEAEVEEEKVFIVVKISDGSPFVNMREEPTIYSLKVGEASEGERFEFISESLGWNQVKLADGSTGYISGKYSEIEYELY